MFCTVFIVNRCKKYTRMRTSKIYSTINIVHYLAGIAAMQNIPIKNHTSGTTLLYLHITDFHDVAARRPEPSTENID